MNFSFSSMTQLYMSPTPISNFGWITNIITLSILSRYLYLKKVYPFDTQSSPTIINTLYWKVFNLLILMRFLYYIISIYNPLHPKKIKNDSISIVKSKPFSLTTFYWSSRTNFTINSYSLNFNLLNTFFFLVNFKKNDICLF